jgi:uncharacterized caspase-like protein
MPWLRRLVLALAVIGAASTHALAEKRVALVIGNGAYANAPHLPNPAHDAEDVSAALKRSNFEVITGTDLDQAGMQDAIIRFARMAQSADVGIFYYSGHAMQYNGINYLMPIDAKLSDEADLYRFTRVDDVLGYLQQAKNLKILVLDSCRDNPLAENFKRSIGLTRAVPVTRGLAKIEAPTGTIVAFSTQAGQQAEDGEGRNSPYTAAFLRHIDEPDEIGDIFRDVSADVYHATNDRQLPELSLSIIGKFYLQGPPQIAAPGTAPLPAPDPCAAAETHWKAADSLGTVEAYEDHLAKFPHCPFAALAEARIDALQRQVAIASPAAPVATAVPASSPSSDGLPAGVTPGEMLHDVVMPGSVFRYLDILPDDPTACQAACRSETHCAAWSYAQPRTPGQPGRCGLKQLIPEQVANICCVSAIERAAVPELRDPPPLPAGIAGALRGIDLFGSDLRGFSGPQATPEACQVACKAEGQCLAWTYERPGAELAEARCWLKNRLPAQVHSACCISGIERQVADAATAARAISGGGAIAASSPMINTNLFGSDYRNFALASDDWSKCQTACKADNQCLAWTVVHPGIQGPKARCWLKNKIPQASANNCCVSGVERSQAQ